MYSKMIISTENMTNECEIMWTDFWTETGGYF